MLEQRRDELKKTYEGMEAYIAVYPLIEERRQGVCNIARHHWGWHTVPFLMLPSYLRHSCCSILIFQLPPELVTWEAFISY